MQVGVFPAEPDQAIAVKPCKQTVRRPYPQGDPAQVSQFRDLSHLKNMDDGISSEGPESRYLIPEIHFADRIPVDEFIHKRTGFDNRLGVTPAKE